MASALRLETLTMTKVERNLIQWMASGQDVGMSAKTIAYKRLGIDYPGACYPVTPSDLKRCMLLLRREPTCYRALRRLAKEDPVWAAYVRDWNLLEKLLVKELGKDLERDSFLFDWGRKDSPVQKQMSRLILGARRT